MGQRSISSNITDSKNWLLFWGDVDTLCWISINSFSWQLARRTSLYLNVSIWVNREQIRIGRRMTERPPGTGAGSLISLIRVSPVMSSGVSWHLSFKLLFSWTNLLSPRQFSLSELTVSIWHLSKEEWKIFLGPEFKERKREKKKEGGEQEQRIGQEDGICAEQKVIFLVGPVHFYFHL